MKVFLELLPYRVRDAVTGTVGRRSRVARRRRSRAYEGTGSPPQDCRRRLYIDLAVVSRDDGGTGIQRVVRALALALLAEQPAGWDVRFVGATRRRPYHEIAWPQASAQPGEGEEIEGRPGDVFLGLDFSLDTVRRYRTQLEAFRQSGGSLWFAVHDLLPIDRPDWFSPRTALRFRIWIEALAGMADGFFCVSEQTEADLRRVLASRFGLPGGFATTVIPMGHRLADSHATPIAASDMTRPARLDLSSPFAMMVGTLEPRKGHASIVSAYTMLWEQGAEHRLVLVGRKGWETDDLCERIRSHPEHGAKLLWFDDVDDGELELLYKACAGLIVGSLAEGFGLPLIEGLGHNKPVLARDLPVFRIHDGYGVSYFAQEVSIPDLAQCIAQWHEDVGMGRIVVTSPGRTWVESARVILATLGGGGTTRGEAACPFGD